MTASRITRLLDQLLASMERERDLLMAGASETLAEEAEARAEAFERLNGLPEAALEPHAARLATLRTAAQRNEKLLKAAIDGAAAGRRRLLEVLHAQTSLASYDATGAPLDRGSAMMASRKA